MLPGTILKPRHGVVCDECGKTAHRGVVGECDSFGYEVEWFCEEHFAQHKPVDLYMEATCECCKQTQQVRHRHDPGEGGGRVYLFCDPCYNRKVEFELNDYDA